MTTSTVNELIAAFDADQNSKASTRNVRSAQQRVDAAHSIGSGIKLGLLGSFALLVVVGIVLL